MTLHPNGGTWPTVPGRVLPPVWEPPRTGLLGARTIGVLSLVEPGCAVWSSTRENWRAEPVGGLVVAVTEKVDRETGEVERAFLCLDIYSPPGRVIARLIPESDIGMDGAEGAEPGVIARMVRRLCRQVADGKAGFLDPREAELVGWANRLAGVTYS